MDMESKTYTKQLKDIQTQATGSFGYNPLKAVKCPHCGGTMEAIDAVKHIRNADGRP